MSLAVVGAVSLFGAAGHWRAGNVNLRVALIFGAVAMAGTYLGARLAVFFSGAAQLILFAVVMLLAAWFMFRPAKVEAEGAAPAELRDMPLALIAAEGLAVGVLTGLVGVGGGFLIVPALVLLGKVPMKQAVGTSLLVIAMKSAAGFAGLPGAGGGGLGLHGGVHGGGGGRHPAGDVPGALRPPGRPAARLRRVPGGDGHLHPVSEPRRAYAGPGRRAAGRRRRTLNDGAHR